jgi:RNA:NAD 2'-phosphotransferase (TPT1/KptA family)
MEMIMKHTSNHRQTSSRHLNGRGTAFVERPPELLYHSMDKRTFLKMIQQDVFAYPQGRTIYASKILGYAWQVAHRTCEQPYVAIIDVTVAKHHDVYPKKNKRNLWELDKVPVAAVLNAHPNYGEQISSGGIPYIIQDGEYKVALI